MWYCVPRPCDARALNRTVADRAASCCLLLPCACESMGRRTDVSAARPERPIYLSQTERFLLFVSGLVPNLLVVVECKRFDLTISVVIEDALLQRRITGTTVLLISQHMLICLCKYDILIRRCDFVLSPSYQCAQPSTVHGAERNLTEH